MFRKLFIATSLASCVVSASADSWDSNANIDKATKRAVDVYKEGGIDALAAASKNCYAGLNATRTNKNAGRDIEYCFALEVAGANIDKAGTVPYLNAREVLMRGVYHLEQAGLITLPDQINPYVQRFAKIPKKIPSML